MGYDSERFPHPISDDLKCMICLDVLEDPQECQTCQTSFCSSCIQSWSKKKNSCPNTCELKLQRSHKFLRSELDKLQITCIFKDEGCLEVIRLESIEAHEKTCDFSLTSCLNDCGFKDIRRNIKNHEDICDYRQVKCVDCCSKYILAKANEHSCLLALGQVLSDLDAKVHKTMDECYFYNHLFNEHSNLHFGSRCKACGMEPIQVQRYLCLTCEDYNECWKCHDAKNHEHSDFAVFNKYGVHENVMCDGCGFYPISGLRYKCQECENFDLCHKCLKKEVHSHHRFICSKPLIISVKPLPVVKSAFRVGEEIVRGWKVFNEGDQDLSDFGAVCIRGDPCFDFQYVRFPGKVVNSKCERDIFIRGVITQNVPGYYKSVWAFERDQRSGIFGPFLTIELIVL